jgi:hypothetical protein
VPERKAAWQETHEHRCGAVSTSDDGKVRLWVPRSEKIDELEGLIPGEAHLQWLDAKDTLHVVKLDPKLHLDNVVDHFVSLGDGRYLILGLRSCFAVYAGSCPRRYARVIQLGETDAVSSVSLMLLRGEEPETGKFRHHLLASNWLVFKEGKVWLEKFPGYEWGKALQPTVLFELREGTLTAAGPLSPALRIVDDWSVHRFRQAEVPG